MLFLGAGQSLAIEAGVPVDDSDWAVVHDQKAFIDAVGRHRNWERATDPPVV